MHCYIVKVLKFYYSDVTTDWRYIGDRIIGACDNLDIGKGIISSHMLVTLLNDKLDNVKVETMHESDIDRHCFIVMYTFTDTESGKECKMEYDVERLEMNKFIERIEE